MLSKGAVTALIICLILALAACELAPLAAPDAASSPQPGPADGADLTNNTADSNTSPDPSPAVSEPTPEIEATAVSKPPQVVEYNLGDVTITQDAYSEDDPYYEMPLRLDGLLGLPGGTGAHPLVLIIHGDHLGCPPDPENDAAVWPCTREQEQLNYRGFEYLVEELAAQGNVALAINANAEFTAGYGESVPGQRLSEIIDLHLGKLVAASQGIENQFGLDLYGRIDQRRVVWIAHSSAGELANRLIRDRRLDDAMSAAYTGYGPVLGLLQVAPTLERSDSLPPAGLPLAVILPACDGQVIDLSGQTYFEAGRDDTQRDAPAATLLLDAANHNQFNEFIPPDMYSAVNRPQCRLEELLLPEDQRAFLADYAASFITWVVGTPQEASAAAADLGLDSSAAVPQEYFGRQALLTISPRAVYEDLLLRPFSELELSRNLQGGDMVSENARLLYCPPGTTRYETDDSLSPCHRLQANHPGDPAQLLVRWDQPGAVLRLSLPPGGLDIHNYAAVQLRATLDPLSPLNAPGEDLTFSLSLTDTQGHSAALAVPAESPALAAPPAEEGEFSGHVQMSALRVPLAGITGLDLSSVSEIALHFDQTAAGALFIADLALVRPQRYPGSYSTLLLNDGSLDHLRSIGRLLGTSTCTATLIDSGSAEAPAVVLTNGHCAQQWSANDVLRDSPAANMQIVFNYFANTRAVQIAVPATRILYSTMKGRDIALIELATTLGELQNRDITPFPLADQPPGDPTNITIIGAPTAELPSDAAYLRQENCTASAPRGSILEHDWYFHDAYRLDCQDVYGGSSGSPVFIEGQEEIFALVNTTTIGGRVPCDLNAPCEITAEGTVFRQDTSYALPVSGIAGCFNEDGRFDLTLADCPLDDGRQLEISGYPQHAVRPLAILADGTELPNTWRASLSGDLPYYRYKIGPLATTDCGLDEGYSALQALAVRPLIDKALPQAEGHHILCVVAGSTMPVDETWQQPRFATTARVQIDTTPPSAAPALSITTAAGGLIIEPHYDPPELASISHKYGPLAGTDCAEQTGYTDFAGRPLNLAPSDLPALLCIVGQDTAGNSTQPIRHIVDLENS